MELDKGAFGQIAHTKKTSQILRPVCK